MRLNMVIGTILFLVLLFVGNALGIQGFLGVCFVGLSGIIIFLDLLMFLYFYFGIEFPEVTTDSTNDILRKMKDIDLSWEYYVHKLIRIIALATFGYVVSAIMFLLVEVLLYVCVNSSKKFFDIIDGV